MRRVNKQKQREKAQRKQNIVKPEQVKLCRFVDIRYEVFERKKNGSYERTGNAFTKGLQVENLVYLVEGSYKYVNRNSLKIMKKYIGVPNWAPPQLKEMYYMLKEAGYHDEHR